VIASKHRHRNAVLGILDPPSRLGTLIDLVARGCRIGSPLIDFVGGSHSLSRYFVV